MNRITIPAVALALMTPTVASAQKYCIDEFYVCLNNTYEYTGLSKIMANAECTARYVGCMKNTIL